MGTPLTTICAGLLGLTATIAWISKGAQVEVSGFINHDCSLILNLVMFVLFLALMTGADRRLSFWSALFVPTALVAIVANQRRAGIAAFFQKRDPKFTGE